MLELQDKLQDNPEVLLLSHTVMPEIDTASQLKKYATQKNINSAKWNLVTGSKQEIYNLARKQYLVAKENPDDPLGLVHTENFVLIDTQKRIRGFYDGTQAQEMERILHDIDVLQNQGKKSHLLWAYQLLIPSPQTHSCVKISQYLPQSFVGRFQIIIFACLKSI